MDRELHILILEDVPADAELMEHELRKNGFAFSSRRVETRDAFFRELMGFLPDIILADYRLPQFTGMDAFRLLRESGFDIPFIIVTGSISEEFAVECMKEGIDDYILKPSLKRLPSAVLRALEKMDLKREKKESDERYRRLVESSPDAIYIHSNGKFVFVNPATVKLLGAENVEQLIGKPVMDFVHPDYREIIKDRIQKVTEEGVELSLMELKKIRLDGTNIDVESEAMPYIYKNESAVQVVSRDITKKKKAEEALKESEERFRAVAETASDAVICLKSPDAVYFWNKKAEEMFGHPADHTIGRSLHEIIVPDRYRERAREGLRKFFETGTGPFIGKTIEIEALRNYGTEFPIELSISVMNVKGEWQATGIIRDITERKKAEEALRKSENKYRTLLQNLEQKIFYKDRNSVYISCNENYARDLKIKSDEIEGRTDYEFYPKELAEKYRADDKMLMEIGKTEEIEEKYIQDGQEVWVHTVKTPTRDDSGNVTGILGIFWDITERKRKDDMLNQRLDELTRFEKATIQREFRMRELKEENKRLKEKIEEMEKR